MCLLPPVLTLWKSAKSRCVASIQSIFSASVYQGKAFFLLHISRQNILFDSTYQCSLWFCTGRPLDLLKNCIKRRDFSVWVEMNASGALLLLAPLSTAFCRFALWLSCRLLCLHSDNKSFKATANLTNLHFLYEVEYCYCGRIPDTGDEGDDDGDSDITAAGDVS